MFHCFWHKTSGSNPLKQPLRHFPSFWLTLAFTFTISCFGILSGQSAKALPSFARQTGQPCAACHTAFPELTPFGRRFKIGGYTLGGGTSKLPPIAAMVVPTLTHTQKAQDGPPAPGLGTNDNLILQQASLFYGGKIYGDLGAFVQTTYDRASERFFLDNTDIRLADSFNIFGKDTILGLTVNNSPTVQDPWNTTPAWSFPYIASSIAPQFGPPSTMIEGGFAGQVVGTGAYAFWNDMLLVELTGYQTMSKRALTTLGEPDVASSNGIDNIAPYWRIALEPVWGNNSLMVGTFGMDAHVFPGRVTTSGSDHITDIGLDAEYQYIDDTNAFTLKVSDIFEHQQLNSSFAQQISSNQSNRLRSFHLSGSYVYDRTYSFSAGLFDVAGSADPNLYAGADAFGGTAVAGSMAAGQPAGRGLVFDLAWLPFSKGGPSFWPWANARIGISYTQYLKLYGDSNVFSIDDSGISHSASDNNTTLLYAWFAF